MTASRAEARALIARPSAFAEDDGHSTRAGMTGREVRRCGLRFCSAVLCLALLSGCTATEPYERPFAWTPTGANAANLAAMAENPSDLAKGRGLAGTDSEAATDAVGRLHHDHVKALLDATAGSGAALGAAPGGGQAN
jgi:type IV pilus biogenesis protein CpaD/CtpE